MHDVSTFSSIDDLLADNLRPDAHNYSGDAATQSERGSSYKWYMTDTYEDSVTLATDGWSEVRPKVDAIAAPLRERLSARFDTAPDRSYDVCGSLVDVAQFMSGEPECMVSFMPQPERAGGKVVRLLVNIVAPASTSADTLMRRGITVLALAEAIEMVGGSCEVVIGFGVQGSGSKRRNTLDVITTVKSATETPDTDRILYALGHPSMMRRQMFAVCAKLTPEQVTAMGYDQYGHGLGGCRDVDAERAEADLVIGYGGSETARMVNDPEAWVIDQLKGLGFEVRD